MEAMNDIRKGLEASMCAEAWKSSRFKEKLLADPPLSALKELGLQIPDVNIRVIEENQGRGLLFIHADQEHF